MSVTWGHATPHTVPAQHWLRTRTPVGARAASIAKHGAGLALYTISLLLRRPQGPEADPIAAAVLSSSLSVEQQHQHQHHQAPGPRALRSQHSGHQSATERAGSAGARGPSPEPGGKHQFFSVYSRTSAAGAPGGPGTGTAASRLPSGRGPSPGGGGAAAATGPSLSVNHPIGLHPSVSSTLGLSHRSAAGAGAGAGAGSGASGQQGAGGAPRARFAGATEMYAPGKLVRPQELDDIEHRATQVATAAAVAAGGRLGAGSGGGSGGPAQGLHARPWLSGPYKGAGLQAGAGSGAGGEARRRQDERSGFAAGSGPDEDEEVQALREKWSTMDARAAASVADVQVGRAWGWCGTGAGPKAAARRHGEVCHS